LKSVFNIKVSYQTVLNYAAAAAFYCHSFNLRNKGVYSGSFRPPIPELSDH